MKIILDEVTPDLTVVCSVWYWASPFSMLFMDSAIRIKDGTIVACIYHALAENTDPKAKLCLLVAIVL